MRLVSGDTVGQRSPASSRRHNGSGRRSGRGSPLASLGASSSAVQPSLASAATVAASAGRAGGADGSAVAVAIADAIERFDLSEVPIDGLELLPQPLDVAVDRAVVDINVLAVGGIHQLVAVLDVTGTLGERFEDQELGDGELYRLALPGAQVARR